MKKIITIGLIFMLILSLNLIYACSDEGAQYGVTQETLKQYENGKEFTYNGKTITVRLTEKNSLATPMAGLTEHSAKEYDEYFNSFVKLLSNGKNNAKYRLKETDIEPIEESTPDTFQPISVLSEDIYFSRSIGYSEERLLEDSEGSTLFVVNLDSVIDVIKHSDGSEQILNYNYNSNHLYLTNTLPDTSLAGVYGAEVSINSTKTRMDVSQDYDVIKKVSSGIIYFDIEWNENVSYTYYAVSAN